MWWGIFLTSPGTIRSIASVPVGHVVGVGPAAGVQVKRRQAVSGERRARHSDLDLIAEAAAR